MSKDKNAVQDASFVEVPADNTATAVAAVAVTPVHALQNDPNVAENTLSNDPFACYAKYDVDKLQRDALAALDSSIKNDRKESQMQIANILARSYLDKLLGDARVSNLYKTENNKLTINVDCLKAIARVVYGLTEKDAKGNLVKLPRMYELRIRNIAPIVFYAHQQRIPLQWTQSTGCLSVPSWFMESEQYENDPVLRAQMRKDYAAPAPLSGKDNRTVQRLMASAKKNLGIVPEPRGTRADNATQDGLKKAMREVGIAFVAEMLADMLLNDKSGEVFSDTIAEHVINAHALLVDRNGEEDVRALTLGLATDENEQPIAAA